jgi:hypothetical protein
MTGGPHAVAVACPESCAGKASRIHEGFDQDWYQCEKCGHRFLINWSCRLRAPVWPMALAPGQRKHSCKCRVCGGNKLRRGEFKRRASWSSQFYYCCKLCGFAYSNREAERIRTRQTIVRLVGVCIAAAVLLIAILPMLWHRQ